MPVRILAREVCKVMALRSDTGMLSRAWQMCIDSWCLFGKLCYSWSPVTSQVLELLDQHANLPAPDSRYQCSLLLATTFCDSKSNRVVNSAGLNIVDGIACICLTAVQCSQRRLPPRSLALPPPSHLPDSVHASPNLRYF